MMKKFLQRVTVGLATAALLSTGVATSVFAESTIYGNGADSTNSITTTQKCKSTVYQSNNTYVTTIANVTASTGGNSANENTGGDVTVSSGDATAGLSVMVEGGSNEATPADCCACLGGEDSTVLIQANGADTTNTVSDTKKQKTKVTQKSKTAVTTIANVKAKTGNNKAKKNTNGSVDLSSGAAEAGFEVGVTASSNTTL